MMLKSFAETLFVVFVGVLLVFCLVFVVVVGAVVVFLGFSRVRCLPCGFWLGWRCRDDRVLLAVLSLLLTKSVCMESHFKQSCAVVSQVVLFVRSLLSPLTLVGRPCFRYHFLLG